MSCQHTTFRAAKHFAVTQSLWTFIYWHFQVFHFSFLWHKAYALRNMHASPILPLLTSMRYDRGVMVTLRWGIFFHFYCIFINMPDWLTQWKSFDGRRYSSWEKNRQRWNITGLQISGLLDTNLGWNETYLTTLDRKNTTMTTPISDVVCKNSLESTAHVLLQTTTLLVQVPVILYTLGHPDYHQLWAYLHD